MAAVFKISDDFYDESFILIAMHTPMEDYSLAYALNQNLNSRFKRKAVDFELSLNRSYSFFEWEDSYNDRYWVLMGNQSTKQEVLANNDLFKNENTFTRPRLLPEYKDVDYLLKIETDEEFDTNELIKNVLGIPQVITAYEIETNKLKSKNNLIF